MKFKDDKCGWRDLIINKNGGTLQVSLYTIDPSAGFIDITKADGDQASFNISVKRLRKFAKAILVETGE